MKYYAVIDTNVIVSAVLKRQSVPGSVVELAIEGVLIPVLNKKIVEEYRTVLMRPKFGLTKDLVENIISSLEKTGFYIDGKKTNVNLPDSKDVIFYEVVMEGRENTDTYLVTGNIKHFPSKPFIVTPKQMLDILLSDYNFIDDGGGGYFNESSS